LLPGDKLYGQAEAASGRTTMATYLQYMEEAMRRAEYERLDDGSFYAHIPGFSGLWATGKTIEDARKDLYEALDGWLTLNFVVSQMPLPDIGVSLRAEKLAE
jgi:predicted RNase H-like HicB family nuclease